MDRVTFEVCKSAGGFKDCREGQGLARLRKSRMRGVTYRPRREDPTQYQLTNPQSQGADSHFPARPQYADRFVRAHCPSNTRTVRCLSSLEFLQNCSTWSECRFSTLIQGCSAPSTSSFADQRQCHGSISRLAVPAYDAPEGVRANVLPDPAKESEWEGIDGRGRGEEGKLGRTSWRAGGVERTVLVSYRT